MKYLLCYLILISSTYCFTQNSDTLRFDENGYRLYQIRSYHENGSFSRIVYKTRRGKADTLRIDGRLIEEMSPEDLFMRNILASKRNPGTIITTDSILYYYENGKIDYKTFFHPHYEIVCVYDTDWKLRYLEERIRRDGVVLIRLGNTTVGLSQQHLRIQGRIGDTVPAVFNIANRSDRDLVLRVKGERKNAKYPEVLNIPVREQLDFQADILITRLREENDFILSDDNDSSFRLTVQLEGYHLAIDDFTEEIPTHTVKFYGQDETLHLLLNGTQKLLEISDEQGRVLKTVSVPKTMNSLLLKGLPKGVYDLTLIDLGNDHRKYCRIKK